MKQIINNICYVLFWGWLIQQNVNRYTMEINVQLIGTIFFAVCFFVKSYDLYVSVRKYIANRKKSLDI